MEQKVVKLQLGKLVAIIVAVAAIAIAATMFVQGSYFKGELIGAEKLADYETATKEMIVKEMLPSEMITTDYMAKEAVTNEMITNEMMAKEAVTNEMITNEMIAKEMLPVESIALKEVADSTIKTLDGDYMIAAVTESTDLKVEKLLEGYFVDLEQLELRVNDTQKAAVASEIPQWKTGLEAISKKSDPAMIDAIAKKFNTAIDQGMEFNTAFYTYFSKMSPTEFGIRNSKGGADFEQLKATFELRVRKALEAKDFTAEFEAIQRKFHTGLELIIKEAAVAEDINILSKYTDAVKTLESDLGALPKLTPTEFDALYPSFENNLRLNSGDYGFQLK